MYEAESQSTLLRAYKTACYEVQMGADVATLRVEQPLPAPLEAYLDANAIQAAAFVSAANPLSRPMSVEDNALRHTRLLRALCKLELLWLPGQGRDPTGAWNAETSVLVLGLARGQAVQLAEEFQQNAYVEVLPREPARLVLTAHWGACNS